MEEYGTVAEEGYVRFLMRDTSHAFLSSSAGVSYVPSKWTKRLGIQLICWCVDMSSYTSTQPTCVACSVLIRFVVITKLFHKVRRKDSHS